MSGLDDKPPYRVPLVSETRESPRNGLTVASTFSGGGGSCYGYELAGFSVVWANEIVAEARDTYCANHPDTFVDDRDIRHVQPQDIFDATGLGKGDLDLFDGSPPCQSFSTAGKGHRGWGKTIAHNDGTKQISDDLFFEYARLLDGLQPKTFVAENVTGLVKGKAKGYYKWISSALRKCGYQVDARILNAKWLGVPQARKRVIFVGIREDLNRDPVFPTPLPYYYSAGEAIADLDTSREEKIFLTKGVKELALQIRPGERHPKRFSVGKASSDKPVSTIMASDGGGPSGQAGTLHWENPPRRFTISELKRLCGFPDDYVLTGTFTQQWARLGNAVPPPMMAAVAATLRDRVLNGTTEKV